MPKVTLVARLADGLPLAASMADEKDAYAGEVSVCVCLMLTDARANS
jgi:hypothetical protein